jgi:putative ABC transport system substrate-binding protein
VGNVTGLVFSTTELDARRLRLLKEAMPRISRVAILWNPSHPLHSAVLEQVAESGRGLGIRAQPLEVWGPEHFDLAFTATRRGYAEAVMVLASPMHYRHLRQIAQQALKHRLPTVSDFWELAEAGGFMAFGPSLPGMYRRAASFVDKILKGAKPGDLPIEQPTKFELVINLKTAKALGLTIPPSLLLRADQVIQ